MSEKPTDSCISKYKQNLRQKYRTNTLLETFKINNVKKLIPQSVYETDN